VAQIYHLFFGFKFCFYIASSNHTPSSRPYVDTSGCFHQLVLNPRSKASLRLVPINACHVMTTQARKGGGRKTQLHMLAPVHNDDYDNVDRILMSLSCELHQLFYCMQSNSICWSYSVCQSHLYGFQSVIPMLLQTQTFIVTHFSPPPFYTLE